MIEKEAKLTSKGQITIPAAIREGLGIKAGDALRFRLSEGGELTVVPRRKRSILEIAREMPLPSLGRPLTQDDIDNAVGEAMREQEDRAGAFASDDRDRHEHPSPPVRPGRTSGSGRQG